MKQIVDYGASIIWIEHSSPNKRISHLLIHELSTERMNNINVGKRMSLNDIRILVKGGKGFLFSSGHTQKENGREERKLIGNI